MLRRYFVPIAQHLQDLIDQPLPMRFRRGSVVVSHLRDIDLDTPGLDLEQAGVSCRLRLHGNHEASLSLLRGATLPQGSGGSANRIESRLEVADLREALATPSEALAAISKMVDPTTLKPRLVLEIDRVVQRVRRQRFFGPCFDLRCDAIRIVSGGFQRVFGEAVIEVVRTGRPSPDDFAAELERLHDLELSNIPTILRARELLSEATRRTDLAQVEEERDMTLLAVADDHVALRLGDDAQLGLPLHKGSGNEACEEILAGWLGLEPILVDQLANLPRRGTQNGLEIWLAHLPRKVDHDGVVWYPLARLLEDIGSPALRDRTLIVALDTLLRSGEIELGDDISPRGRRAEPLLAPARITPNERQPDRFFNGELSQIEFNLRVLELAEDPRVPLLERFRFLAILTRNLDELFMVRVAALKRAVAEKDHRLGADGLSAMDQLNLISIRTRLLVKRQHRCLSEKLLPALAEGGIRLLHWTDCTHRQQRDLRRYFDDQVFPLLTPHALTISPGHPFPHIVNLDFSIAAILRDPRRPDAHFAHVRVPSNLPRFVPVPDSPDFIPIERLVAANYEALYPQHRVEETYVFRVTRSGALELDEAEAVNLLDAVEREVQLRPYNGVLRVEIDSRMPRQVRELLLRELAVEKSEGSSLLTRADLYLVESLIDLRGLEELAQLDREALHYAPFAGITGLDPSRSIFDLVTERDRLLHHPYESFESTIERFLIEAAHDPDVVALKLTQYRSGSQSGILDALLDAASRGVETSVFVELKARFDEETNVEWAKRLEDGGVHVVHGLVGLKTHAKMALVVRREGDELVRYAHIGTGNYNVTTASIYTDLSLLTADPELTADVQDLFNELTGSAAPPCRNYRQLLVAPPHMLSQLLDCIEREAEHARAGRGGRIRAKLNGLADREIIEALYRASGAGVKIDLAVRGICLLRPGVPGLSEHIRVISILGRFLEHARIFHFANAGEDEYFIGSADWRARNLRRRVEIATPVREPLCRTRLDTLLDLELADPTAWELRPDGRSDHRQPAPPTRVSSVQDTLIDRTLSRREPWTGATQRA